MKTTHTKPLPADPVAAAAAVKEICAGAKVMRESFERVIVEPDRPTHVSIDGLRWTREEFDEVFEMCRRVTAKIADGVMACEKPDVLASAIAKLLEHVNDPAFE